MTSNFSEILLNDLRAEKSTNLLLEIGVDGGVKFPDINRAMIHFMLRGNALFRPPRASVDMPLHAGDSVLVFYGDSHAIVDMAESAPTHITIDTQAELLDEIPTIHVGGEDSRAYLLTCALELAYLSPSAAANRAAADFTIIRNGELNPDDRHGLMLRPDQLERCCRGTGATAFASTLASLQLVNFCRRSREELWFNQSTEIRDPNTRRISAALRKIHAHPDRQWTVAKLAAEVGLSRSSFAYEFVNCLGMTPHAYLTEVRMKRAASLLQRGLISCREVASRVGYPLENSFSRAFKRYYGAAPRAYGEGRFRQESAERASRDNGH